MCTPAARSVRHVPYQCNSGQNRPESAYPFLISHLRASPNQQIPFCTYESVSTRPKLVFSPYKRSYFPEIRDGISTQDRRILKVIFNSVGKARGRRQIRSHPTGASISGPYFGPPRRAILKARGSGTPANRVARKCTILHDSARFLRGQRSRGPRPRAERVP